MNKLPLVAVTAIASLVFGAGVTFGQDNQEPVEIVSKIVPVEIFTCSFNDGQGQRDLDAAVDAWTGFMDDNDIDNYASWTLTRNYFGSNQDFDFIWLGAWADGNAMGADTDMWFATGGEYIAKFARVATCNNHINAGSINYKLPEGGTPANAVLTFSNCKMEDDVSYGQIVDATKEWAGILTDAGSQAAIYHWFPIYGGGGGDDDPDFITLTAYPNHTELGADYERITNGELFRESNALFGGLMDCDLTRVYNARSRRVAQLR